MKYYAIYRNGRKIRSKKGNPRTPSAQKGLIIWNTSKRGVTKWINEYGTKKQKKFR